MAWDEGNAINRADGIRDWFEALRKQGTAAFGEAEIARHWHYTVEIEGHPALYGIVIALGESLAGNRLSPLTAARLGPMMLFSVAAGAMFYRLTRQYSLAAAIAAVAAMMTMPRLFAHAHFASFDGPLTSCWILAWAMFMPAVARGSAVGDPAKEPTPSPQPSPGGRGRTADPRWRFGFVWGIALGATMSCKFTGWLAPLPFVGYAVVYGDRKTAKFLGIGFAAALATLWLVNPRLWHHPVDGMQRFFDLNLNRAGTRLEIPTLFFGQRYDMQSPLPWYNTLIWTAITVPTPILLLGGLGIASVLRRWAQDGHGTLILANWLVLIVARALPGTPVHDAERLILPSFAFLAALAGIGCHQVAEWARSARAVHAWRWHTVLFVLALSYAGSLSSLVWYAPQWLSYYNLLIGGLRGADAAGMEATYYWDALDNEVLEWLHRNTAPGDKIDFAAGSTTNLELMRRWGLLKRGWRPNDPGEYRWRVVQRRPTFWSAADHWLIEHDEPAFAKTIRPPNWGVGPWRLDVPLIEVFSDEQFRSAQKYGTFSR
jgi:4-amino-4-deoxy-L-arabinose transferase-like glycosyltransferase